MFINQNYLLLFIKQNLFYWFRMNCYIVWMDSYIVWMDIYTT